MGYERAEQLAAAAVGKVSSFIMMGTIWVYGHNLEEPVTESHPMNATDAYGTGKIEITEYLTDLWNQYRFPFSILHLGHLVGKGWVPLNPQGNFNKSVFEDIAAGRELLLPDRGSTTLHHVHTSDVAQLILYDSDLTISRVKSGF